MPISGNQFCRILLAAAGWLLLMPLANAQSQLDQIEADVQLMQRAETEQVDFEQPQLFEAILVPLNDGAIFHRPVLDRHDVVHRLVAE